jgi:hypothetical protein
MRVLDFADDSGALLRLRVRPEDMSETVKTASWKEPADMKPRDYALILIDTDGKEHGKYACHDEGNVLVSMVYLEAAQPHLNRAAVKTAAVVLSSLAKDWGMPVPVEIQKLASIELSLSETRGIVDSRRVHYHPPRRIETQKTASGPFEKLADAKSRWTDLTPFERRDVAREMIKAAEGVPLSIPNRFYQYAGEKLGSRFQSYMHERLDYVNDPETAEGYKTLAKIASSCDPDSVVTALYELDALAHLRWSGGDRYGEKLADPVRCVYDTDKVAAYSWNHGAEATNENELFALTKHPTGGSRFLSVFTPEVWAKFRGAPSATFQAMPLEQKILLSRMAREV